MRRMRGRSVFITMAALAVGVMAGPASADTVPDLTVAVQAGDTVVSTLTSSPTADTPLLASVTATTAGEVTFRDVLAEPVRGYTMMAPGMTIMLPETQSSNPHAITFSFRASELPAGAEFADLTVFADGKVVAPCAVDPKSGRAAPIPCTSGAVRAVTADTVSVLAAASVTWTFGTIGIARIAGSDRYDTARVIAETFAQTNVFRRDAVILANGTDAKGGFDALSANYLAGVMHAPILLTSAVTLPKPTVAALTEIFQGATGTITIYVMGRADSVSPVVRSDAIVAVRATAPGAQVVIKEISGQNRYATAAAAASAGGARAAGSYDLGRGLGATMFLASGEIAADALAAGAVSAAARIPVLLTPYAPTLPGEVLDVIRDLGIKNVIVLGGPDRVSKAVVGQLGDAGVYAARLAGSGSQGRFDTAAMVNEFAYAPVTDHGLGLTPGAYAVSYIANGADGFADALAVGPLAAATTSPLLTVPKDELPASTGEFLKNFNAGFGRNGLTLLGQEDRITPALAAALLAATN